MRRQFLTLIVSLLTLLHFAATTTVASERAPVLAQISDSGTLRVAMSAGQPPYNMTSRDGDIIGLDVDLASLLAKAMGVQLRIEAMPFAELLPALESGKADLVISGMTSTLRRNMRAAFVGPYHITGKSILARSETVAALKSESLDSDSLKIAALAGSTSEDFVRTNAPNAALTTTKTYDDAIDLLLVNKVDLFVADVAIVMVSRLRWPNAGLVSAAKPLTLEPIGVAVAPNDPLFLNLVENYMEMLRKSGTLEQLEKKWFENGGWLTQLP